MGFLSDLGKNAAMEADKAIARQRERMAQRQLQQRQAGPQNQPPQPRRWF